MATSKARLWFGATVALVVFGLVVQVAVAVNAPSGFFQGAAARTFNVFCFFTIQSNVIVGVTSLLLGLDPTRSSTIFNAFRLTGVAAIALTGLVYHSVLRGLFDLESWALVADHVIHTIVPVMGVSGWLIFGPRGRTSSRVAKLAVIFPVCWLFFTLVRGEIIHFYPYPFVDVLHLGYGRVAVNCVWVAVLYLGMASGLTVLDGWLARVRGAAS